MDDIDNRYLSLIKHFKREKGQFQIIKELGRGNFGVAFELNNGNVVKFTTDKQEIKTCKKLVGHINKYLCNIHEIGKTPLVIDNYEYFWIIEEKLFKPIDKLWINESFADFRHAWFSLYPDDSILHPLYWSDLWKIYKNKETDKIYKCRQLLENYVLSSNQDRLYNDLLSEDQIENKLKNDLMFFDFIETAYNELFDICPNGRIDLNEGNFMFDYKNQIKVLDLQAKIE